jgi:hypothetical protein
VEQRRTGGETIANRNYDRVVADHATMTLGGYR